MVGRRAAALRLGVADHLIEVALPRAAVVAAVLVYHTAMETEKMPQLPLPEAHP
jgi:hypothetical protein